MNSDTGARPATDQSVALLDSLAQTFDHAASIVAGIAEDQLGSPTPCREWDVQTILDHMTAVVVNRGRGASGEELLAMVLRVRAGRGPAPR